MRSEKPTKFNLRMLKDSPALAYTLCSKYVVAHHPLVVFFILSSLVYQQYFSTLTFVEIAAKGNWKEMRLYAAYTIMIIARGIPWVQFISLALENVKMLNILTKSLENIRPMTGKYIKRVLHENSIFQLVTVYMFLVTCFAYLMRIISLESEKEYNYALKYIQENFGTYDTYGIVACILVDCFFASYNLLSVVNSAAQINGISIRFSDIIENMEAVNRRSAIDQSTVNNFLKYAAKRHAEILRYGRQLNKMIGFQIVRYSFSTVITITSCLYLILTAEYGHLNIASIIFLWISTSVLLCHCGQKITDVSSEFYDFLYNLPWYTWNGQNKKIYLMMLMNSSKNMAFSCYEIRHINYAYLQDVFRCIYSLACLGCELK